MNTRPLACFGLFLFASGCTGGVVGSDGDSTTSAALTLPAEPNWATVPTTTYFGLPLDALVVGVDNDGTQRYACRASVAGGIHPGQVRLGWNDCRVGYAGGEQQATTYQVLVPNWTAATGGVVPADAMPFGNEADGSAIYVCRGSYVGSTQLGKIAASYGACLVPYGGQEVHLTSYEVLTGTVPLKRVPAASVPLALALRGGKDSDTVPLFPCVAPFNGGLHVGKTRAFWDACDVSWGGGEHYISSYDVLVPELSPAPLAGNLAWIAGHEARFLLQPGQPLGICAAPTATSDELGKYRLSGACNYAEAGAEIAIGDSYQVLAAAHPLFVPSSFDYGSVGWDEHYASTITLVADFDDDVSASLETAPQGYHIDRVTSWKPAGTGAPVIDQQVTGSGPLHVLKGERVTVDLGLDTDPINYSQQNNAVVVRGAAWSFRVPLHANVSFLGNRPVLLLGRNGSSSSDQRVVRGAFANYSFDVTNLGTQPGTYVLGASAGGAGLTVDSIAGRTPTSLSAPLGSSITIQPGEVQSWWITVHSSKSGPYLNQAPITITLNGAGVVESVVDTLTVISGPCAAAGMSPYEGIHEGCCPGTGLSQNECRALPCAPKGQAPNSTTYSACCAPNIGSPCAAPPPPCAPNGQAPNSNGHGACCAGLAGNPCQPPPPCAPSGSTPNSGGHGACCPGLSGSPCRQPGCTYSVMAHATICTNYYDGSESSLSHTLCAAGCGSTQSEAETNAKQVLSQQTCLGDDPGCCQVLIDQDFNNCGK
jgi:hypothetical protein